MDESYRQFQALLELDARHDELLDQLEELDKLVAHVLAEWTTSRPSADASSAIHAAINPASGSLVPTAP